MRSFSRFHNTVALSGLALCTVMSAHAQTVVVSINPIATYLRVSPNDNTDGPVLASVPFALASAGIRAGDVVHFDALGGFSFAIGQPDTDQDTIAVFSSSSTLLASDQQFRVSGALAAGATYVTPNTFFDNLVTDIPQDFNFGFRTPGGLTLTVPQGAQYLFFSVSSSAYSDNRDPNGDYAARITVITPAAVPEPGSVALLATSALTGAGFLMRGRKQARKAA